MLNWRQFFLAYLRSRIRLLVFIFLISCLALAFHILFTNLGSYFLYFFLLCSFLTLLFFIWDILVEAEVYRKEMLYSEREAKSPLECALAEKLEEREAELYQKKSDAENRYNDLVDYYTLWVHQIKTPIAASKLLVREVADRQLKQQLEQEIFKIDSYTNLVLQYLRLESFHDDLVLKKENIEDLVKEVIRKYAIFFIQKNLSINMHDLDRSIVTDKKWLLVVIEQILSNSLKYTNSGGIEIYMEDQELCIKDTGIGIKNSDVLRVFERGFSGYNGRMTQQSSGLGLYLTQKISQELGHQIRIESELGQGTTVRIKFAEVNLLIE
ncbi:sensor histidine kinase [Streptococcus sp. oral taxon 061]|uniref:sensor histidine kinase n=1 Tax=Streptococcus sp. oral taxon 061 TaxID=712623 RepID=UPI0015BF68E6|nr:sensor histidine kinase [Streptococcus sp. oral taxon 061]QLF55188.1 sensor histidine kinase [Streptococcus sp. oral taxon 061]